MVKGASPTLKTEPGRFPLVVTASYRRTSDAWQIEGPAVCIPLVSSTGHGDAALHRVHFQDGKFALANLLVALLPNTDSGCDAKYLYHLLTARKDELLVPLMQGTANVSLKEQDIAGVEIPLPPLPEQRRMVARIEELAAQIHEARTLRHQAAEEADAVLLNHVGNVFAGLSNDYSLREFASFAPHITSGPRNWAKHYEQNGSRFYRAQDVGPAAKVLEDSKVFITPPPGEQGRTAMLHPGDLMLVITGATVGRVNIYRKGLEPGFVSQHVGICRLPQSQVEPDFALWGLRGPTGQAQLLGQRYGQGKPGLNLTNIRALSLPFPPLPEQRRIVAELDALQAEVDALKHLQAETATELDALLPAILDRAFKGEL
jgi:hypothetical protein